MLKRLKDTIWAQLYLTRRYRWLGVITGCLTLVMVVVLSIHGAKLKDSVPHGGVSLQLAGSAATAEAIIGKWRAANELDRVRGQVWWDFLFVVGYSGFLLYLGLACASVAEWRDTLEKRYGSGALYYAELKDFALACGLLGILAGLMDVLENFGILLMLDGHVGMLGGYISVAMLTTLFASLKFALIGLSFSGAFVARLESTRTLPAFPPVVVQSAPAGRPA